jgi:nucleoside-diphosphate-sugar epimerase
LLREKEIRAGAPLPTDPSLWLNLIHVEDGVEAVLGAEQRAQPGGVYNVCDDNPVKRGEFFQHLASLIGAPPPSFDVELVRRRHANRRVLNWKMRKEMAVALRFPNYQEGLVDACGVAIG